MTSRSTASAIFLPTMRTWSMTWARPGIAPPGSAMPPADRTSDGAAAAGNGPPIMRTASRRSSISAPAHRRAPSWARERSFPRNTRTRSSRSIGHSAPSTPSTSHRRARATRPRPRNSSRARPFRSRMRSSAMTVRSISPPAAAAPSPRSTASFTPAANPPPRPPETARRMPRRPVPCAVRWKSSTERKIPMP